MPKDDILGLLERLTPEDTRWMMQQVESLQGPQDYMDDLDEFNRNDNAKSKVIVWGFFKYIDLISGLILKLGNIAIEEALQFEQSQSHYVPWVLKYCCDSRFIKGIRESLPFLEL